jgi:AraC-like DNA-binding protein
VRPALHRNARLEHLTPRELRRRRTSLKLALRARDIIHARWNECFPVDFLSKEINVPLSSLERTFTETFGTSPRHYQNYVRVMRGKELLAHGGSSIAAIANTCGFRDPKYFARLFRREFAQSPGVYRQSR